MGTVVNIDLFGAEHCDASLTRRNVDVAEHLLHQADEVFSTWNDRSPLSRLRRGEVSIGEVPPMIVEVLEACRVVRRLSRGWFDPWSMPGGVDPTGLVKGWAAQRALDALRALGVTGAVVNAAGDLASFGGPQVGESFHFGVVRPDDPMKLACVVASPGAVATSGTYLRGNHLVDPFTGHAGPSASATVTGTDLGVADALATALALAGSPGLDFLSEVDGYEGLVMSASGEVAMSDAFPLVQSFFP